MIWVETGSGVSPSRCATYSSTRGSRWANVPTAPDDLRHRDLRPRRRQPFAVAGKFGIMPGQFEPERGRLGMDAVAAADGEGELVLERPRLQCRQHRVEIRQQQLGRLGELHRQAGVQHVGAGHSLVHEAAVRPDRIGQPGEEGDHVVTGFALDLVDAVDVGRRRSAADRRPAPLADGARGGVGDGADRAMPSAASASISNQMR